MKKTTKMNIGMVIFLIIVAVLGILAMSNQKKLIDGCISLMNEQYNEQIGYKVTYNIENTQKGYVECCIKDECKMMRIK